MIYVYINDQLVGFDTLSINKTIKASPNSAEIVTHPSVYDKINTGDEIKIYHGTTLIFFGYVDNKGITSTPTTITCRINARDYDSIPFSRIFPKSFTNLPVPLIIGDLIASVSNTLTGTKLTSINVKFVGYPRTDGIQVTKLSAPQIEFTIDDWKRNTSKYQQYVNLSSEYKFPNVSVYSLNRPVLDFISTLLSPDFLGLENRYVVYLDETKTFIFKRVETLVSELQYLSSEYEISFTGDEQFNFVIAYLGNDLNNNPIYMYEYKDLSGTPNIKETLKQWADIAEIVRKQGITDNVQFRRKCIELGKARANALFYQYSYGKRTGSFTVRTKSYYVGQSLLIKFKYSSETIPVLITDERISFSQRDGLNYRYSFEEVVK